MQLQLKLKIEKLKKNLNIGNLIYENQKLQLTEAIEDCKNLIINSLKASQV